MNSNSETSHKDCRRRLWKVPFVVAGIVLIKSAAVMLLWNALVPDLFHGPLVSYVQAMGLTVLAKLLVGFGHKGHFGGRFGGPPWKHRFANMSEEERQKLREAFHKRCGG